MASGHRTPVKTQAVFQKLHFTVMEIQIERDGRIQTLSHSFSYFTQGAHNIMSYYR
jgi:hypothetical protein